MTSSITAKRLNHMWLSMLSIMAMLLTPVMAVTSAAATTGSSCQDVTRNVALGPNLPASQTVKGTLCVPFNYDGQKSVDVLVHGATYNRDYWDWPTNSPQYSYVKRTQVAGRATFAYDRLGTGASSRPLSSAVTVEADAYVLHQLIDWLRSSKNFTNVNLVGHSFGSIVAINETATYNDANKLVVTGLLHIQTANQTTGATQFYPATLDPQFAGQTIDAGYLTTVPGSRASLFYSSNANSAVITQDEATKDVVSGTQFGEGLSQTFTPAVLNISQGVRIPVLVVVGTEDFLFCGSTLDCSSQSAIAANELPYYASAPNLRVAAIGSTGHDLTLHPTADASFLRINAWIKNN